MKTVLGIDLGTQSSKVIFYDYGAKKIVAEASAPHELKSGDDGTSEQEAAWWVEAIRTALQTIPEEVKKSAVALALSGQQHGFVPLDKDGEVLYRVKLWNDTSTVAECAELTKKAGGERALLETAGNLILPGYTAGKILWFKKHKPELFAKMAHILLPHDYINFLLTGDYSMEYGDASGTGLLNIGSRTWNKELCDSIDPAVISMLPPLSKPEAGAGVVSTEAAALFGLPEGIPVATGGGDNMMAAIGTAAVSDGSLSMSLGTSGTLFGYSKTPVIDDEGLIAAFCSSNGGWLPLLCTMNCTVATEKNRDLLDVSLEELDELTANVPPGSNGVTVLPFFSGERIPNMPQARASIMGLSMSNTGRDTIMRASMEAAIFGLKLGLDSLQKLGMQAQKITLTGGGSRSRVWSQMAADITGLPILLPLHHDAAAIGASIQALWYHGVVNAKGAKTAASLESLVKIHIEDAGGTLIQPGEAVEDYKSAYTTYKKYLEAVKPLYT